MIGSYGVISIREDGEEGRRVDWKGNMDEQSKQSCGSSRGKIAWELLVRLTVEYAAEVWWTGGFSACRKLELANMTWIGSCLGQAVQ